MATAPPSAAAIALASAIISGLLGFYLGQAHSIGLFGRPSKTRSAATVGKRADDEDDDDTSDISDADSHNGVDLGELKSFPGSSEECKLVLVTRTDLGMGKVKFLAFHISLSFPPSTTLSSPHPEFREGHTTLAPPKKQKSLCYVLESAVLTESLGKIAAQCSHATLACYKALLRADPAHPLLKRWEQLGQAKVALKVDSEEDLLLLQAQAVSLGLCAQVIHDAGRTQIASGSATVLGIGPAPKSKVDEVTGHLKLL